MVILHFNYFFFENFISKRHGVIEGKKSKNKSDAREPKLAIHIVDKDKVPIYAKKKKIGKIKKSGDEFFLKPHSCLALVYSCLASTKTCFSQIMMMVMIIKETLL